MEQIIYLEPDDDIQTIRERLSWIQADRALLVIPRGHAALRNPVNLRLLVRHVTGLGLQVGLVTRDRKVIEEARDQGIAVFSTVEHGESSKSAYMSPRGRLLDAERGGRHVGSPTRARPSKARSPVARAAGALIGLCLLGVLLAGAAYLVVPSAQVTITLSSEDVAAQVAVQADTSLEKIDEETQAVPAREVRVDVHGQAVTAVTSKKDLPDISATGDALFTNKTAESVEIPAGTVIATSSGVMVRFQTVTTLTLAPEVGANGSVEIVAVEPGPRGNLAAFIVNRVEGTLAARVTVVNDRPTSGGTVKQVFVAASEDRDRVRALLLQQLYQEALTELEAELLPQEFLPEETMAVIPLSETYDKFLDEPAKELGLTMQVVVRGIVVSGKDANVLAVRALEEQTPEGMELLALSLQFQVGEISEVSTDRVKFVMTVQGVATSAVDEQALIRGITGKTVSEAAAYLEAKANLTQPPDISVSPEWLGRIPILALRVRLVTSVAGAP